MFVFYILAVAVIYCLEMYIIRVGLFCRNVFITNVNNTFMEELIYAFNIISWSVWLGVYLVSSYLDFLNHYYIFRPSKRNLPASFLHTTVGWGTPVTLQGKVISCPSTTSSSCGFVTHSGGTVVIKSSKRVHQKSSKVVQHVRWWFGWRVRWVFSNQVVVVAMYKTWFPDRCGTF